MSRDELTKDRLAELAQATPVPPKMVRWSSAEHPPLASAPGFWARPLMFAWVGAASVAIVLAGIRLSSPDPAVRSQPGTASSPAVALSPTSSAAHDVIASSSPPAAVSSPSRGASPAATPPPSKAAATAQPVSSKNCMAHPSGCGYPDSTNSGLPAGTATTSAQNLSVPGVSWDSSNHTLYITGNNITVSNVAVDGVIRIEGDHDTVKNTVVTNCWPSGYALVVAATATNAVIQDTTLTGKDAGSCSISYGVQNLTDGMTVTGERLRMENCSICWSGPGTMRDSYVKMTTSIASQDAVSYGGGSAGLTLQHNTMFDPTGNGELIFLNAHWGALTSVTISDNLLAGGKHAIYGQDATSMTISGNRFSNIYFPQCGAAGVAVVGGATAWSGNVWDDSLQPVAKPG